MRGIFPPHAPPSLWLLGVSPAPNSSTELWGIFTNIKITVTMTQQFTNDCSGAAFCRQNSITSDADIRFQKTKDGGVFFSVTTEDPTYRKGYVSKKAWELLSTFRSENKEKDDGTLKAKAIASLLDFAIVHYVDNDGVEQSCPTLMPQASGELLW